MDDLTTPEGAKQLLERSQSESEWNANTDQIKRANRGYPAWWFAEIVSSGFAAQVAANWRGEAKIHVVPIG